MCKAQTLHVASLVTSELLVSHCGSSLLSMFPDRTTEHTAGHLGCRNLRSIPRTLVPDIHFLNKDVVCFSISGSISNGAWQQHQAPRRGAEATAMSSGCPWLPICPWWSPACSTASAPGEFLTRRRRF